MSRERGQTSGRVSKEKKKKCVQIIVTGDIITPILTGSTTYGHMLWSALECFGVYEYMYYGMHTTLGRGGIHCSDSRALAAFWSMFRYSKSFGCILRGCSDRPENPHTFQRFAYEPEHFHVLPSICMYSGVKILQSTYKYSGGTFPCYSTLFWPIPHYSILFHPTLAYSTYSMPFHLILLLWPIPCYSGPFHTTPTHSMLLQPIQHYSMLLRPIACNSNTLHATPTHSTLFHTTPAHSTSSHAPLAHSMQL
jgi:hypothetical protein